MQGFQTAAARSWQANRSALCTCALHGIAIAPKMMSTMSSARLAKNTCAAGGCVHRQLTTPGVLRDIQSTPRCALRSMLHSTRSTLGQRHLLRHVPLRSETKRSHHTRVLEPNSFIMNLAHACSQATRAMAWLGRSSECFETSRHGLKSSPRGTILATDPMCAQAPLLGDVRYNARVGATPARTKAQS